MQSVTGSTTEQPPPTGKTTLQKVDDIITGQPPPPTGDVVNTTAGNDETTPVQRFLQWFNKIILVGKLLFFLYLTYAYLVPYVRDFSNSPSSIRQTTFKLIAQDSSLQNIKYTVCFASLVCLVYCFLYTHYHSLQLGSASFWVKALTSITSYLTLTCSTAIAVSVLYVVKAMKEFSDKEGSETRYNDDFNKIKERFNRSSRRNAFCESTSVCQMAFIVFLLIFFVVYSFYVFGDMKLEHFGIDIAEEIIRESTFGSTQEPNKRVCYWMFLTLWVGFIFLPWSVKFVKIILIPWFTAKSKKKKNDEPNKGSFIIGELLEPNCIFIFLFIGLLWKEGLEASGFAKDDLFDNPKLPFFPVVMSETQQHPSNSPNTPLEAMEALDEFSQRDIIYTMFCFLAWLLLSTGLGTGATYLIGTLTNLALFVKIWIGITVTMVIQQFLIRVFLLMIVYKEPFSGVLLLRCLALSFKHALESVVFIVGYFLELLKQYFAPEYLVNLLFFLLMIGAIFGVLDFQRVQKRFLSEPLPCRD